jgi:hypothetical protein
MTRNRRTLRRAKGTGYEKIFESLVQSATPYGATPGACITGGVATIGMAASVLTTGMSEVFGCAVVNVSPTTPTRVVSITPQSDGTLSAAATPAGVISWIAYGRL